MTVVPTFMIHWPIAFNERLPLIRLNKCNATERILAAYWWKRCCNDSHHAIFFKSSLQIFFAVIQVWRTAGARLHSRTNARTLYTVDQPQWELYATLLEKKFLDRGSLLHSGWINGYVGNSFGEAWMNIVGWSAYVPTYATTRALSV